MKVLVLSGRFGMGHEMAANAICEQFRKIDEQAEIEKLLRYVPSFYQKTERYFLSFTIISLQVNI